MDQTALQPGVATGLLPLLLLRQLAASVDQTDAFNALAYAIPAPTAGDNLRDDAALKQHTNELSWDDELIGPPFVEPRLAAGVFRPAQPADACRA
jgi:hypothetical protein